MITIDDYIPALPWNRTMLQTMSCGIPDHKIMVALIEKAFAKLCGSYTKLKSGMVTTAWAHMTGCCDIVSIWSSFENPLEWAP